MNAMDAVVVEPFWDENFSSGFSIGSHGGDAKWNFLEMGPFCPKDGVISVTSSGLDVVCAGSNPRTGEPAFVQTVAPAPLGKGLPGMLDHIKWSASANRTSSLGFPGFDTKPGKILHIEAIMGGRTFGTDEHPFGDAVRDPQGDLRLAAAAMVNMDKETNVVFDFFLTNTTIYALYERAPFAREQFGNYASFSYGVPVGSRTPDDLHKLAVAYDYDANVATWLVDGKVVLEVDNVGRRIERKYVFLDVGGDEQIVRLNQIGCGIGMFTIMDGSFEGGPGLVDLPGYPMYFNTGSDEPLPLHFVDQHSREDHRIFGQGARVTCKRFSVSYL